MSSSAIIFTNEKDECVKHSNETQPPSFPLSRDAFPAPFVWLFY